MSQWRLVPLGLVEPFQRQLALLHAESYSIVQLHGKHAEVFSSYFFNLVILLSVVAFSTAQLLRSTQHRTFTVFSTL
jgi:hypothetical protein